MQALDCFSLVGVENVGRVIALSAARFYQEYEEHENQYHGQAAHPARLRTWTHGSIATTVSLWRRIAVYAAVRNENLPGTAVVVGTDGTAGFELADELGCPLVADMEMVAQHHGCDGCAGHQELYRIVVERVAVGQGRRQHGHVLGSRINSRCRRGGGGVEAGTTVGTEVGVAVCLMSALGAIDGV